MNKKLLLVLFISVSVAMHLIFRTIYEDNPSISASTKFPLTNNATYFRGVSQVDREDKDISKDKNMTTHIANISQSLFVPQPECEYGYFKINGIEKCRPWLNCSEILQALKEASLDGKDLKERRLGEGLRKKVFHIPWINPSNHKVTEFALSMNAPGASGLAAQIGARNLRDLQPSNSVIKMTGYCEMGSIVMVFTENCGKYGALSKFIKSDTFATFSATQRFKIAIQVVQSLVYIHYGSGPPKVHCDMHDPLQSLNQFLVTDDLNVVLNDVDELPVDDLKNNQSAMCVPVCMPFAAFLAPEQRYPPEECKKVNFLRKVQRSSVKSDVWKIPNLTKVILSFNIKNNTDLLESVGLLKEQLIPIHEQCKIENIDQRANSTWVLQQYTTLYNKMISFLH